MGAGAIKQAVPPTPEHSEAPATTVKPLVPAGTAALKTAATRTNPGAGGAGGAVDSGRVVEVEDDSSNQIKMLG